NELLYSDAFSQRISSGKKMPRKILIDDRDARTVLRILVGEGSPSHHLNSKGFEIPGSDHLECSVGLIAGLCRGASDDVECHSEVCASYRRSGCGRGLCHPRNSFQLRHQLVVKTDDLLWLRDPLIEYREVKREDV